MYQYPQVVRAIANHMPMHEDDPNGLMIGDKRAPFADKFREFCSPLGSKSFCAAVRVCVCV